MPATLPGPAYRILTPRLLLRCWEPTDAFKAKEAIDLSVEHLRPFMNWAHREPNPDIQPRLEWLRKARAQFDADENYIYGIFDRAETRVMGGTGLHPRVGRGGVEIGYWIRADAINQGYATETAAALTKAAFEIYGMARVEIHCEPANVRSAAVPKKLGFQHETTLKSRLFFLESEPMRDEMIWTMFAEDYPDSPSAAVEIEAYDALGRRIM